MPVLVIVEEQKEYVTPGRPFYRESIGRSPDNPQKLQAHARAHGWKIAQMRHEQNSMCFAYGSPFAEFIDGFGSEETEEGMVKPNLSCFSSREFQALLDKYRHAEIILAGYGTSRSCLSTVINAHHRGHAFTFVADATCAKRTGPLRRAGHEGA